MFSNQALISLGVYVDWLKVLVVSMWELVEVRNETLDSSDKAGA